MARPDYVESPVEPPPGWTTEAMSVELSSRRTGMSFQRTRMSAERTLMSIIRTALSLIGFGFTIFQFFKYLLRESPGAATRVPERAPLHFGLALVTLGVAFLALGIVMHARYLTELRRMRAAMASQQLIHADSPYPRSLTLLIALLLLLLGFVAIIGMMARLGPLR